MHTSISPQHDDPFYLDREELETVDQERLRVQLNDAETYGCFEAATKEEAAPIRPSRQASEQITAARLLVDQQLLERVAEVTFAALLTMQRGRCLGFFQGAIAPPALVRALLEDATLFVAAPR